MRMELRLVSPVVMRIEGRAALRDRSEGSADWNWEEPMKFFPAMP